MGRRMNEGEVVNPKKRKKKDGIKVNIVQGTCDNSPKLMKEIDINILGAGLHSSWLS